LDSTSKTKKLLKDGEPRSFVFHILISSACGSALKIIGCDFHPSFQQIAMVDTEIGKQAERRIARGEA
jgi:hypothetical protein